MEDNKKHSIDDVAALNVDSFFIELEGYLKQQEYEVWSDRINNVLSSQLIRYRNVLEDTELSIRKTPGKKLRHVLFDLRNVGDNIDVIDDDLPEIVGNLLVEFPSDEGEIDDVRRTISDLKGRLKFDALSQEERERTECIFKEQDVYMVLHNYILRRLDSQKSGSTNKGYTDCLRAYLHSIEELNQSFERLRTHSTLYPGWRGRGSAKKVWMEEMYKLLDSLKSKHSNFNVGYSALEDATKSYRRCKTYPTEIQDIQELSDLEKNFRAKDPQPIIKIKKVKDGIYIISMEPTKDYEIIEPSLILSGKYQPQTGTEVKVNIDLTRGMQGNFASNEVIRSDTKKLEVKLTLNLEEPLYSDLRLNGSYELPYLKNRPELGKLILIAEMVRSV